MTTISLHLITDRSFAAAHAGILAELAANHKPLMVSIDRGPNIPMIVRNIHLEETVRADPVDASNDWVTTSYKIELTQI